MHLLVLLLAALLSSPAACAGLSRERLVYDKGGVQIGIEHDPTTDRSTPLATNSHPAALKEDEVRKLLSSLKVSGYTGTLGGFLATPPPFPLFNDEELRLVAGPVAAALAQAGPQERVFFSLPNLAVQYSDDRTAGALFIRGAYLHVMLRDHSALMRTDTSGGEDDKDLRDTKGMKLWAVAPARAATLSAGETPRWGPFEKVHIALNVRDVLNASATPPPPPSPVRTVQPVGSPPAVRPAPEPRPAAPPQTPLFTKSEPQVDVTEDLRLQIRELTISNLELRTRLEKQAQQMKSLQDELARMKRELKKATPKTQAPRKPPVE